MSYWIEITDPDDITIDGDDVDIRYNSKDGNCYITLKLDFLYEKIRNENIDLMKKWKGWKKGEKPNGAYHGTNDKDG
jgi:hypothetical protein